MGIRRIMISRIAEQSFWMFRYLEREELLARSYLSRHLFGLDSHTSSFEEVYQLSERERSLFLQIYSGHETDEELIQYFRVWQQLNPDSLETLLGAARNNALLIREVITEGMWQMINKLYLWLQHESTKNLYTSERYIFYTRIIETIQQIKGVFYNSLLRDEYYQIMSVGILIERSTQIMSMLDKLNSNELLWVNASAECSQAQNHLLSCFLETFGATQNYFRRGNELKLPAFINFFLKDSLAPQTLAYALKMSKEHISSLQSELNGSNLPFSQLQEFSEFISNLAPSVFFNGKGISEKQQIFSRLNHINAEIHINIFNAEKILV